MTIDVVGVKPLPSWLSPHFGTCMYYTCQVAAAGCVAMLNSNGIFIMFLSMV
jgi:hypothetical protein